MNHAVIYNVKYYNKVNDVIDNELKLDCNPSLSDSPVKYPQPIVTIRVRGFKKSINA